jgi:drug/metabolite transporter (DMT)-like permease
MATEANTISRLTSESRLPYLHMLWASLSFAGMGAFGHWAGENCAWQFVGVARTCVAFVIALVVAKLAGVRLVFNGSRLLWMRSLMGSLGLLCNFYAITHLPISDSLTLSNTHPIWVTLMLVIFFRQNPALSTWLAVLLGVSGIVLIQQPHFESGSLFAGVMALCGALCTSMAMLGLNRLQHIDPRAVVAHFSGVSSATTILFLLLTTNLSEIHPPRDAKTLLLLFLTGLTGVIGQWGMTMAFAKGHASHVSVVALTQIVFALGFDLLIWHRQVNPVTLAGMLLVTAPVAWLMLHNQIRRGTVKQVLESQEELY